MTRQLINLIGGLVTVLVLVAGVVLIGLPMYSGAQAAGKEADDVARGNATQQIVIDGLRVQEAQFDQLEDDVAQLRRQIAVEPRVDDVVALALAAVSAQGGTLDSVSATEAVPFAVRVDEQAPAPAAEADPGTADASATDENADAKTDGAADATAAASAPAAAAASGADTQLQVPVTLAMTAPSVEAATSIVDALRRGPRVLAVTQATTTSEEGGVKLNVEVLVFVNRS